MERLIIEQLQLQEAASLRITVDDLTLDRALESIAKRNNLTLAQFRDALARDGYTFKTFRNNIRNEMLISRLRKARVNDRITITQREVDEFLQAETNQTDTDRKYRLRHILLGVPDAASPETIQSIREKANALNEELRAGANFMQKAITLSDGQQALEGGDLGWRKIGQVPTLFVAEVRSMQVGDIAGPIQSPAGFHFIKLEQAEGGEQRIITQTLARHILIQPSAIRSDEDARKRLTQLRERIELGDDFAQLARANSDDKGTAIKGGELPWAGPNTFAPQFEEAMAELQPNQISEPFKTRFGWHILQVLDRREHDDTENYQRNQAREQIFKRKIEEETELWLRRLRDEAFVELRDDTKSSEG
jgi:peptidyl-prolyl cis-trans isomerase SurA